MYLNHFGFKRRPFAPVPDHRELFQTRGHQEARARLRIALEEQVASLFVQRLRITFRMPPVDEDEARRYIAHRLRTAGGDPDVLEPDAVECVVGEVAGRLRSIDHLCTQALYAAFIASAKAVTKLHVDMVISERVIAE